eukprot:7383752-Prymnesium_polylepis.1
MAQAQPPVRTGKVRSTARSRVTHSPCARPPVRTGYSPWSPGPSPQHAEPSPLNHPPHSSRDEPKPGAGGPIPEAWGRQTDPRSLGQADRSPNI